MDTPGSRNPSTDAATRPVAGARQAWLIAVEDSP
jgi:hypothetical protein